MVQSAHAPRIKDHYATVSDYLLASRQTIALTAAVHLGLFDALSRGAMSISNLAEELEVQERPLDQLVSLLVAMELVVARNGVLTLSPVSAQCLVTGQHGSLRERIELEAAKGITVWHVIAALRDGRASITGSPDDVWQQHDSDLDAARTFTAAMHSNSEAAAFELARLIDFSGHRCLIDFGGGSGVMSIEVAHRWPHMRALVLDRSAVCRMAAERVHQAGLSDRVSVEVCDFNSEPLPATGDVALLSQILHDWPQDAGRRLLSRIFDCLPPGGLLLIHEKLLNADGTGPLTNVMVNLDMLVWTEGRQWLQHELEDVLQSIGFARVQSQPTVGYWTVTSAVKP